MFKLFTKLNVKLKDRTFLGPCTTIVRSHLNTDYMILYPYLAYGTVLFLWMQTNKRISPGQPEDSLYYKVSPWGKSLRGSMVGKLASPAGTPTYLLLMLISSTVSWVTWGRPAVFADGSWRWISLTAASWLLCILGFHGQLVLEHSGKLPGRSNLFFFSRLYKEGSVLLVKELEI